MTNAERIRAMSDEGLLEWLDGLSCACVDYDIERCKGYVTCRECWKAWLAEEADEAAKQERNGKMRKINALRYDASRKSRIDSPEKRGEMLDTQRAADFLGISKGALSQMTFRKEVPSYKYFNRVVFFSEELKRFRNYIMVRN